MRLPLLRKGRCLPEMIGKKKMALFYRALRGGEFSSGLRNLEAGPKLLEASECIQGRSASIPGGVTGETRHLILDSLLQPPYPAHLESVSLGMGCFWCSEALFFRKRGVYVTAVGFAQGVTGNPTYEEVCSGRTNHVEVVRVVYDPEIIKFEEILKEFWDRHDPTCANRQGNDVGTQYRSGIYYTNDRQRIMAEESKKIFQHMLNAKYPNTKIVTEIEQERNFFFAEEYHQQYDAKPGSRQYCGLKPTGVTIPLEALRK